MNKKCPCCGKIFECSHSASCWCTRFSLPEKIKAHLSKNYNDCLCEDCLKDFISKEKEL